MSLFWLLHAFYATALAYGLAHAFGHLSVWLAAVALLLPIWIAWRQSRHILEAHPDLRLVVFSPDVAGALEICLVVLVLYVTARHFLWLLFVKEPALATLSTNNYSDLPLHINYIRALANGIHFPPANPSYASQLLRYPFGSALYNALWESIGVRLETHLLLVGLLSTVASLTLLRTFAGWWGIGAFFLSGGLAGLNALTTPLGLAGREADWKNLLLTVFITQRGMLFALPAGLLLLLLARRHLSGESVMNRHQMTAFGVIWAFLPLFHLHAFVVVSLMLVAMAASFEGVRGVASFLRSRMALIAYGPATYFILFSTDFLRKAGIAHWRPGWMAQDGHFGRYLLFNFGPWLLLPFAIAASLSESRELFTPERRRQLWIEFATYSVLLVLFFNLMLAPWSWDNIKVLIWPYLGFARLAYVTLQPRLAAWQEGWGQFLVAGALFASGFVAVLGSIQSVPGRAIAIYQIGELASTAGALAAVPADAVFAAAPIHHHTLTYFGRLRAIGYPGHIWSHGILTPDALHQQEEKLRRIFKGDPAWHALADELGITHIFWGPAERAMYGTGTRPWTAALPNVSRVKDFAIYEIPRHLEAGLGPSRTHKSSP